MAGLNRIILVGRLTADPEGRSTMEGFPMTKFRLEVDRPQGMSGADFMDIITWRGLAENCSGRLKKGHLVLVEGRIQIRSFEDQTGQRRWATEIVARNVQLLEKPSASSSGAPEAFDESVEDIELASDLPF